MKSRWYGRKWANVVQKVITSQITIYQSRFGLKNCAAINSKYYYHIPHSIIENNTIEWIYLLFWLIVVWGSTTL